MNINRSPTTSKHTTACGQRPGHWHSITTHHTCPTRTPLTCTIRPPANRPQHGCQWAKSSQATSRRCGPLYVLQGTLVALYCKRQPTTAVWRGGLVSLGDYGAPRLAGAIICFAFCDAMPAGKMCHHYTPCLSSTVPYPTTPHCPARGGEEALEWHITKQHIIAEHTEAYRATPLTLFLPHHTPPPAMWFEVRL